MVWRFLGLSLWVLGTAWLGWALAAELIDTRWQEAFTHASIWLGGLAGGLSGLALYLAFERWQLARFVDWLKGDALGPVAWQTGMWADLTDRTRRRLRGLQTQWRESEHRLDAFLAALQASPSGVVLLGADGRIEWFNQMSAQHFGLNIERDLKQFFVNMVRDPAVGAYFLVADFTHDVVIMGRHSTPSHPVRLSLQIFPYGEGRQLLLSRDVTALEQAEAMRRDFVANVSHEIRTPLTVISGFIETLQSLPLDAQARDHYLGLMAVQANRMQSLVNDLLVLSRLEGSPVPVDQRWCEVLPMLEQVQQEAQALSQHLVGAAQPIHPIHVVAAPGLALCGTESEILSALANLGHNAVRYTPAATPVTLEASLLDDGRLAVAVRDAGPGIASQHLPRLTERFYRVDRSRSRDTGGTGLGLAIVKHVMQHHGGTLQVESQLGKGACFTLLFPASRVRATPAAGQPAP